MAGRVIPAFDRGQSTQAEVPPLALTAARRRNIRKAAEEAAAHAPEGPARDRAFQDCEEVLTALNTRIETRVDALHDELIQILKAYAPHKAAVVVGVTDQLTDKARELVQQVMKGLSGIEGTAIRACVALALVDILPALHEALIETDRRAAERAGEELD